MAKLIALFIIWMVAAAAFGIFAGKCIRFGNPTEEMEPTDETEGERMDPRG